MNGEMFVNYSEKPCQLYSWRKFWMEKHHKILMTVQKKQQAIYQIFWDCPKQNPTGIEFCIIIIIIEFR